VIWTSIKTQVLKDMKARIAELEAENEALVETQRRKVVLLLGDREKAERALKQAEAERDALRGFLAERCLLSSFDGEPREEGK